MKRLTIDEFRKKYPDEDACLHKLFEIRYKNLVCPKCEGTKEFVRVKNRRCYHCPDCCYQVYPCKDTVFEKSTTPLTYWFYAIFLQTTTRNGVAAKELQRQMKICYPTALRMNHQVKILIANKFEKKIIDKNMPKMKGKVQVDEAYLGMDLRNKHRKERAEMFENNETKFDNKTGVIGFISDNKEIRFEVMDGSKTFKQLVKKHVDKSATIVSVYIPA